jgi:spore germination protein YaaH
MKVVLQQLAALTAACLASCSPAETTLSAESSADVPLGHSGQPVVVLGYFTGSQAARAALVQFQSQLNAVSADSYLVTASGGLNGSVPTGMVETDRQNGIRTYACVSNFDTEFNPDLGRVAMITQKDKMISQLVNLAQTGGFAGINVDFEDLYPADRDVFTAFMRDLGSALHAQGLELAVSAPAKTSDDPRANWAWPFDLAALGAIVDVVQLMTYDQHSLGDVPGPVSGLDWMESCLLYATSVIDPAKILLGLPAYGNDWDLAASSANTRVAWKDVSALQARTGATPQWDSVAQSAFMSYTSSDRHQHQIWYETPASIQVKAGLVAKYHLAGLSMWELGQEDTSFWNAVSAGLR